jgi:hypothetical protein
MMNNQLAIDLYSSGIRPLIDEYLLDRAKERRNYGEYWPASSAGYCMRKVMFDRLQVPYVKEEPRKQRVFEAGHIFHEWIQRITKEAGLSIEQESELVDDELKVKGHFDDLVVIQHTILYDYKTAHSYSFKYKKDKPMSHFHRMQLATYIYMLRKLYPELSEGRILIISKDDLRMDEKQLIWSEEVEHEVISYWEKLNEYWKTKKLPPCTCEIYEGGFMAKEKYNPYFWNGEPCSFEWFEKCKQNGTIML